MPRMLSIDGSPMAWAAVSVTSGMWSSLYSGVFPGLLGRRGLGRAIRRFSFHRVHRIDEHGFFHGLFLRPRLTKHRYGIHHFALLLFDNRDRVKRQDVAGHEFRFRIRLELDENLL